MDERSAAGSSPRIDPTETTPIKTAQQKYQQDFIDSSTAEINSKFITAYQRSRMLSILFLVY